MNLSSFSSNPAMQSLWLVVVLGAIGPSSAWGQTPDLVKADRFLQAGMALSEKTHYLEALDLLDDARMLIEKVGNQNSPLYADVLFALALTKIKGRIHQDFPAFYVKSARKDIEDSNRLRGKLPGVLPQKLAEGLYLEGTIHQRFFKGERKAHDCFSRCVEVDPGNAACKRELSPLIPGAPTKTDGGAESGPQDE